MKKALILLFCFGAGTLALSLFAPAPETVSASADALNGASSQTSREVIDREGFDVDVLVDGAPLPEYYARGRSYVEASQGAEYELRIHNPLGERVAVALAVDGLNSIED